MDKALSKAALDAAPHMAPKMDVHAIRREAGMTQAQTVTALQHDR